MSRKEKYYFASYEQSRTIEKKLDNPSFFLKFAKSTLGGTSKYLCFDWVWKTSKYLCLDWGWWTGESWELVANYSFFLSLDNTPTSTWAVNLTGTIGHACRDLHLAVCNDAFVAPSMRPSSSSRRVVVNDKSRRVPISNRTMYQYTILPWRHRRHALGLPTAGAWMLVCFNSKEKGFDFLLSCSWPALPLW